MYRAENGSKKFSFTRLINNSIPNLAGAPQDTDLSTHEEDLVFTHQLSEPDPLILSPQAFLHAGITSSPKVSAQIYRALTKNGVLVKEEKGVHTDKIGKRFAHELAMITSHAQKKVVNLLFWWEEEGQRWYKLTGELEELRVLVKEEREVGGDAGTYEKRVAELEGEIRLKPGLRGEKGRGMDILPEYSGERM